MKNLRLRFIQQESMRIKDGGGVTCWLTLTYTGHSSDLTATNE